MSYQESITPKCIESDGAIEMLIEPRKKDLGDFSVRRVLPSPDRQMVGPFIFFDHMGPASFPPGEGIQVRPHPHIGIATITYLFEGEIIHRDSLGNTQAIQKGAVNLMTAGGGIVHSERAGADLDRQSTLHGIQSWIALPGDKEKMAPEFKHYPASDIPAFDVDGISVRLIMGEAYGHRSTVTVYSPTLYLECLMPAETELRLPDNRAELAAYVVSGEVLVDEKTYGAHVMMIASSGSAVCLQASKQSRIIVIGGDSMGERHLWWNFVSSSKSRIEQAKTDWQNDRFDKVPGEIEFIPLPEA